MQRVSGNPLASPEVLGIGGGAAMGVTVYILLFPTHGSTFCCSAASAARLSACC